MTVVEVAKGGSCIIRNMETHDGIVNMIRSYCIYENGKLKQSSRRYITGQNHGNIQKTDI